MERLNLRKFVKVFGSAPVGEAAGGVNVRSSGMSVVHQGEDRPWQKIITGSLDAYYSGQKALRLEIAKLQEQLLEVSQHGSSLYITQSLAVIKFD
jgi:hypothetical protein